MTPLVTILAVLILSLPQGALPDDTAAQLSWLAPYCQDVALQWELLDPREKTMCMACRENFISDLKLLQRRMEDMADAPLLRDRLRLFPPYDIAVSRIRLNLAYQFWLREKVANEPLRRKLYEQVQEENKKLYFLWGDVRDAACDSFYVSVRRIALKHLKKELGAEAYYNGCLPPPVPVWYFIPMD